MLQFIIGFAFLMLLLVPIGFFVMSLIYSTGEELRHEVNSKKAKRKSIPQVEEIPFKERIRAVK